MGGSGNVTGYIFTSLWRRGGPLVQFEMAKYSKYRTKEKTVFVVNCFSDLKKKTLEIDVYNCTRRGEGEGENVTGTNVHIYGGVGDPTWLHYLTNTWLHYLTPTWLHYLTPILVTLFTS